jgi:hypothetical protein
MKAVVRGLVFLLLCLPVTEAVQASHQYFYYWRCVDEVCSFSANQLLGVQSYAWEFGDGTYGAGRNVSHTYDFPGSGTMGTSVTLTYHFSDPRLDRSVRCYVQWYERGIGGDPTTNIFEGTCQGFN